MKTFTTPEQLMLQTVAARAFTALRRATPEDTEAVGAAAFLTAAVSPTFEEMVDYAETHALPAPDRTLYEATMRQLAAIGALVAVAETSH